MRIDEDTAIGYAENLLHWVKIYEEERAEEFKLDEWKSPLGVQARRLLIWVKLQSKADALNKLIRLIEEIEDK